MPPRIDYKGKSFGKLKVTSESDKRSSCGEIYWTCECECGKVKDIIGSRLKRGTATSCGCSRIKHGLSRERIYSIRTKMVKRCYDTDNTRYHDYGARGIKVCDEWLDDDGVTAFYEWAMANGYDKTLTLDRINVDGDYEPLNCQWITNLEQQNNKRDTIYITINNVTKSCCTWAREYGLKEATLRARVYRGWTGEKLLNPVK